MIIINWGGVLLVAVHNSGIQERRWDPLNSKIEKICSEKGIYQQ